MDPVEHAIDHRPLSLDAIENILLNGKKLTLSTTARKNVETCRAFLDQRMQDLEAPIYGVNTGFGSLCNTVVPHVELEQLQHNLVVSHACGMGEAVSPEIVRLMLLLKIQGLSYGHSGVHVSTIQRLIDFYNHGVLPVIYDQGSLGASGDLAPLAHLSLPLIGLGEVMYKGAIRTTASVLEELGWEPLKLQSKEGLALLNGTQFMSAHGISLLLRSRKLVQWADVVAALSLDVFDGRLEPFHYLVHQVRPHPGQQNTAQRILKLLEGSALMGQKKVHVQDPYSFRCVPQVHGASRDWINFIEQVFVREVNSVTDNPTIFPEEELVISAGNFHGQPLALGFDSLCIALAELGSIAERRIYKLVSGERGLPEFLVAEPGLHSGFMIPQYTAASIVSQNKQLCTPASVDTIDSSNGQEDHVSMGANAATKALKVVQNVEKLLAIELWNGAQALHFRRPATSSPTLENLVKQFSAQVPVVHQDKVMYHEMEKALQFLRQTDPMSL